MSAWITGKCGYDAASSPKDKITTWMHETTLNCSLLSVKCFISRGKFMYDKHKYLRFFKQPHCTRPRT